MSKCTGDSQPKLGYVANKVTTNITTTLQNSYIIYIVSFLLIGPVQYCRHDSAVLPWTIAGVSLSVNVFSIIYLMFLWYVTTSVFYVLKALLMNLRLLDNKSQLTLSSSPKEHKKKGETESGGQNVHVNAENRPISRV